MSDPVIICPHVPGHRAVETTPATLAVMTIERTYPVLWVECLRPTDYAAAVIGLWSRPGDLVIIEQDMEPSLDMVEDLLTCPAPACAQAYWLAPASTGRAEITLAAWGADHQALAPGAARASYSAIGLCKISEQLRCRTPPIDLVSWKEVEGQINRRVNGQWHIHWPVVPHHHGFQRGRLGRGRRINEPIAAGGTD